MSSRFRYIIFFLIYLIIIGCKDGIQRQRDSLPPPLVQVQYVKPQELDIRRSYLVTLEPEKMVSVTSRATGYVVSWMVDKGDRVKKGQCLATIDFRELNEQERQAFSQVQSAKAAYENAKEQADRMRKLGQQSFVSPADIDAIETQVRIAEANLKLAEAGLNLTKTRKGYATIESPIDGYIIKRQIEVGTFVSPQGPPLFLIGNVNKIKAIINLPQPDIPYVKIGQPVKLLIDGIQGEWEGKVARLSPTLDTITRTLEVESEFENPEERLKPGMFGRVTLVLEHLSNVILIPQRSVFREGNQSIAYVVKEGKARQVILKLGRITEDGKFQVIDGLKEGDVLITLGREMVRDGMMVRVKQGDD